MGMTKRTARERKRERAVRSSPPSAIPTLEPSLSEMYILNQHNWTNSKSYSSPRQYITCIPCICATSSHHSSSLSISLQPTISTFSTYLVSLPICPGSPNFSCLWCNAYAEFSAAQTHILEVWHKVRLMLTGEEASPHCWCPPLDPRQLMHSAVTMHHICDALHSACITHCKQYCCTVQSYKIIIE